MYSKPSGYECLPQGDAVPAKPGLYVATESLVPSPFHHHKGHSFDYIPNVRDNDYSDTTQGWLSWICNVVVCLMVYICTFISFPVSGWFVLKVVPNYQRIVVFRLGRVRPPKGPGVVLVLPLIDQWQRVDLRTRAFNIPPCQVTATGHCHRSLPQVTATGHCHRSLPQVTATGRRQGRRCEVTTRDGGMVSVGADIQFRIWSPVMSVVSVQDLNASTRLTAHNAMTTSLCKKSVREIQTERIKLGEYLGMDINEMTKPWGLEVDRVELTVGAVLKPPEDYPSGPGSVILPPSIPGLEGLAGPIQQLAMHFLGNMAGSNNGAPLVRTEDSISFSDEVSSTPLAISRSGAGDEAVAVTRPMSVLELIEGLFLSESLVSKVRASFLFLLQSTDGQQTSYYVDLSQGSGSAGPGPPPEGQVPDVTLSMTDQDLLAMFEGTLRPFAAYTTGRLKVQGDLKTAMKLEEVIKLLRP